MNKVKVALQQLRYTEPARLRAYYVQAVLLLASLGLSLPGVVDRWVGVGLAVLAIAAPYYQGRKTRADVWAPATVDDLTAIAALFPGLIDRARQLLGTGMTPAKVITALERESLAADPAGQHAADRLQ